MASGLDRISIQAAELPSARPSFAADFVTPVVMPEDSDEAARVHLQNWVLGPVRPAAPTTRSRSAFSFAAGALVEAPEEGTPAPPARGIEDTTLEHTTLHTNPFGDTSVVGYRQRYRGVRIYGAAVGVEMTPDRSLVNITGHLANLPGGEEPRLNLDPVATLSPAAARQIVKGIAGIGATERLSREEAPSTVCYYDTVAARWRLAYVFEDVRITERVPSEDADEQPRVVRSPYRVFIDAHSGEEIARDLREHTLHTVEGSGADASGHTLHFNATDLEDGRFILEDQERRIRTLTLQFSDVNCGPLQLPGNPVTSDSTAFSNSAAAIAHLYAARVYDFYRTELKRNSIDGNGMWIISTVDCLDYRLDRVLGFCKPTQPEMRTWKNAFWTPELRQMVYGQTVWTDGHLHSFAEAADVVGHEMTHGVISFHADLAYRVQSGALNESLADIFGTTISNAAQEDVSLWNWELGEELSENGTPTRDLQDPARLNGRVRGQSVPYPAHMNQFAALNPGELPGPANDQGFVHFNSSIHNKAAYNLFTSGTFTWHEVIRMYYVTLTFPGRLVPNSNFADMRAGILASCQSLFHGAADLDKRLAAVRKAYAEVGIGAP